MNHNTTYTIEDNAASCDSPSSDASHCESISSLEANLSKTIMLNHAGILCLERNETEKAVRLFSKAFSNNEKLVLKAKTMSRIVMETIKSSNGTLQNDFFVRHRHRHHAPSTRGQDGDDTDAIFRDSIRLPSMNDILSSMNNDLEQIADFLTSCHAYNLALANHLSGLTDAVPSQNNSTQISQRHKERLGLAGRFYEVAMRSEKTRSRKRALLRNDENGDSRGDDVNTWFAPRIMLACLNNLGHVHYRTKNYTRSRACYQQLRRTTIKILELKRRLRAEERDEQIELQSNESNDDVEETYYLPTFWTNSCRGLSRVVAGEASASPSSSSASTSRKGTTRSKHYVTNSSAAPAA